MFRVLVLVLGLISLGSCSKLIYRHQEFRGAWVASVRNIDWPVYPTSNRDSLLGEFRRIASYYENLNFNALIVQIRPAADAFYASDLEPWSEWYTGIQGKGIVYDEDLLPILIEESHSRGLEFHAWLNPYRAVINADSVQLNSSHVAIQHPEWMVRYGDNLYFDPGIPDVQEHVINVVADIVERYDIDAIHFDDYFYPYRIDTIEFPDTLSFQKYGAGFQNKDDWRRQNVNTLVQSLSLTIKKIKPWVKFGISPFGVWRNRSQDQAGSDTEAGQTNYDDLFADVLLWQQKGWLDYLVPQIYWHIGFDLADYSILTEWWSEHHYDRHLYIGQGAHRILRWDKPEEMGDHLRLAGTYKTINGNVYFSAKSLMMNPLGFSDTLRNSFYRYPASIPSMPWMDNSKPEPVSDLQVKKVNRGLVLNWQGSISEDCREYAIIRSKRPIDSNNLEKYPIIARIRHPNQLYEDVTVKKFRKYYYTVIAVDRAGNFSLPSNVESIRY